MTTLDTSKTYAPLVVITRGLFLFYIMILAPAYVLNSHIISRRHRHENPLFKTKNIVLPIYVSGVYFYPKFAIL